MAEESARLRIPYIAASQAQKHVTHNEAMTLLDTLVQLAVLDKDLTAPPGSPDEGDAYIVAAGATDAWLGWDGRIARFIDGTWRSYLPGAGAGAGWRAYVIDEGKFYVFDGTDWNRFSDGREVLTANRSYYVRTDGSDSNDGLTNSSGGAFLTVQKAVNVAQGLDGSIYNVTINVAAGTFNESLLLGSVLGSGTFAIVGDTTTPANVVIDCADNSAAISMAKGGRWTVSGVTLTKSSGTALFGILCDTASLTFTDSAIGSGFTSALIECRFLGFVQLTGTGTVTLTGSSFCAVQAQGQAVILKASGLALTVSGSPAYTTFAMANSLGLIQLNGGGTVTGTATGKRFDAQTNGVITYASGAASLPGDAAGTTATGGQAP